MTRARDQLILTGHSTHVADDWQRWTSRLNPAQAKSYFDWVMPVALDTFGARADTEYAGPGQLGRAISGTYTLRRLGRRLQPMTRPVNRNRGWKLCGAAMRRGRPSRTGLTHSCPGSMTIPRPSGQRLSFPYPKSNENTRNCIVMNWPKKRACPSRPVPSSLPHRAKTMPFPNCALAGRRRRESQRCPARDGPAQSPAVYHAGCGPDRGYIAP